WPHRTQSAVQPRYSWRPKLPAALVSRGNPSLCPERPAACCMHCNRALLSATPCLACAHPDGGRSKMIKRGTLAVMCALFIVAVACAPGGGEQSPAEEAATGSEPGEDVELTVWSWRQEDVEQYEAMFAVYEEQNPGVKV